MIQSVLGRLAAGTDLSLQETTETIDLVMQGKCDDAEIALLLTSLSAKGETVDEIAGAALALRGHMTPIRSRRTGILDTCGPGGGGSSTFNVSTTAAIVAAAAGVPVAKHGNRSVTSTSGSADVLAELGVNIEAPPQTVQRCLDELGLCFCFAPMFHPAMKCVAQVRKKLGVRTIFNLLGPLCNPASASFQLMGVPSTELRTLLARAMLVLGTTRSLVVTGEDGLGDLSVGGRTHVTEVSDGQLRQFTWVPADFGLELSDLAAIRVEGPQQSAAIIRDVLGGSAGPARDIVILNAAAALYTTGQSQEPRQCAERAAAAIDSGLAAKLLADLAALTN